MTIRLLCIGLTKENYLKQALKEYEKRLSFYTNFKIETIPGPKLSNKSSAKEIMKKEEKIFRKKINSYDSVILLDENGKNYTSEGFSEFLRKKQNASVRSLVFVVGGAYGFSEEMKKSFKEHIALSKMTFSHQMIRLLFSEQLYRAYTILNNHPYHNS